MRDRRILVAALLALAVGPVVLGQAQPNSASANMQWNANDPAFTGPYPLTLGVNAGAPLTLNITDSNGSQPFLIIYGTLQTPGQTVGTGNVLDVSLAAPVSVLLNGVTDPTGAQSPMNAFAFTNGAGNFDLFTAVPFNHPTGVLGLSGGTFQAAVGDPAGLPISGGITLTAATTINVTAVAPGTLPLGAEAQVAVSFQSGMTFSFYGQTYATMNVIDNGLIGFGDMSALLALGPNVNGATALGVSTQILGLASAIPANVGVHADWLTSLGGGTGSIQVIQDVNNQEVSVFWINVTQSGTGGAPQESFSLKLYMDGHATSPGQVDIVSTSSATVLTNFARSCGISPGGSGTVSNSVVTTPGGVNLSGMTHTTTAFTAANTSDAIFQVFNFSSPADPINPNIDLGGLTMSFLPAPGTTPKNGPYTHVASPEPAANFTTLQPNNGFSTGGNTVTLNGSGFRNDGSNVVTFGPFASTPPAGTSVTVLDSERITCVVPADITGGPYPYTVDVNLATAYSQLFTLPAAYAYQQGIVSGTLSLTDEELDVVVVSPFNQPGFSFYGTYYSVIHVHANGFAELDNNTSNYQYPPGAPQNNAYISTPTNFLGNGISTGPKIAPLFVDLCTSPAGACGAPGASVTYTENTALATLRVDWNNVYTWGGGTGPFSFGFELDFNMGTITLDYSLMTGAPNAATCQGAACGLVIGITPGAAAGTPPSVTFPASGTVGTILGAQATGTAIYQFLQGATQNPAIWPPATAPNRIIFVPTNVALNNQYRVDQQ